MKSDLPNASQFSPVQTPLPKLLQIVRANQPDRKAVSQAIHEELFPGRDRTLADNTVIAMSQYGLVDKPINDQSHVSLTALGESLADKASQRQEPEMYTEFVRHILLNLRGLDLVACIDDLIASGESPTKARIVKELRNRGIYHPPNGTHANGMRQWFEAAQLVGKGEWAVNKTRLQEILGEALETIESYSGLTREQRDFARAFARLNVDQASSNEVAHYAATLFGTEFPEGGLPQNVLLALAAVGLIEYEKTTMGRGAKPHIVRPTDQLRNDFIEPILLAIEESAGLQYRTLIRMRYSDILANLKSESTHEKGLALEALAFFLARLLGLKFVQWRLRSNKTGGGELDVVMESSRLIFSRWQIQCKNAKVADLEDVAKEVGLAQIIKSNVIVVVTTGRIGPAARQFADQVMKETNLYVALLDGEQLKRLSDNPAEIAEMMNVQAEGAMTIKKGQVTL